MFAVETSDIVAVLKEIMPFFTAAVTVAGGVALAWIAWQQNMMKEELSKVKTQTDGLATAFGAAKLAQGTAEGTIAGLEQGRDHAAVVAAAAAEVVATAAAAAAAVAAEKPIILAGPVKVETVAIDADVVNVDKKVQPPTTRNGE